MRLFALIAPVLLGCAAYPGRYLGVGTAPKVSAPRAVSLQVDVAGDERDVVEEALAWIVRDNGLLRRVPSGGEARVTVETHVSEERALLAGTELVVDVRVRGEGLDERQRFRRDGLTSNVPYELEELLADGVAWALGRAAISAAAPPPPPTPAPTTSLPAPTGSEEPPPAPPPAAKKRHRRR